MATRKDIAREAGVSQGTVSNVLNGRGNVSSEKIRLVESAAAKLGYTINERARILRKGSSNILSVILPNLAFPQYEQFYNSFQNYAESRNYRTYLYTTDDNAIQEKEIISRLRSDMVAGIAAVSCLSDAPETYSKGGIRENEVLFVERSASSSCHYIGFDYAQAGRYFGRMAAASGPVRLAIVTDIRPHSNELAFCQAFTEALREDQKKNLFTIQVTYSRRHHQILQALQSGMPESFYLASFSYASTLKDILANFFPECSPTIHTLSPLFTMPEQHFDKYELNYALLGQEAARMLLENLDSQSRKPRHVLLNADGRRDWTAPAPTGAGHPDKLDLLLLTSPETLAIQSLAKLYTQQTGIRIECTLRSYDEIYSMLSQPESLRNFDIIRLDVTFLSWFADRILTPLEEMDPSIRGVMAQYASGIADNYSSFSGHLYALPFSPSVQILCYRKDLFENTMLKRIYQEQYRATLEPPVTFKDFHQIAAFFTRANNPASPVTYGASLTLGRKSVAASEFMTRYRASSLRLHNADGKLDLNEEIGRQALEQLIALKPYVRQPTYSWWSDTAAGFSAGEEAMTIIYSNYAQTLVKPRSKVLGKIGVALVPGQNPLLGGASLGIPRGSAHPQEALRFLRWLCSEPVSSATALLNGIATCQDTYDNMDIQNSYPWMKVVRDSFSKVTDLRPPLQHAEPFNERQFLNIIGATTQEAYQGKLTPEAAIAEARNEIRRKMD